MNYIVSLLQHNIYRDPTPFEKRFQIFTSSNSVSVQEKGDSMGVSRFLFHLEGTQLLTVAYEELLRKNSYTEIISNTVNNGLIFHFSDFLTWDTQAFQKLNVLLWNLKESNRWPLGMHTENE